MQTRHWTLVAFTLLMQGSIGTVLVITTVSFETGRAMPWHTFETALTVAVVAGAIALVASLLHLGHPASAWMAITNVRSSWVSREIAGSMLFVMSAASVLLLRRVDNSGWGMQVLAAAAGLFVVYAMARLYMVPAQPAWNSALTPVTFIASALLLGTALVIVASRLDPALARRIAQAAIALLVIQTVLAPMFLAGVPGEPSAAIAAASLGTAGRWLTAARIAAAIVTVVLLVVATRSGTSTSLPGVAALVFLVLGELAGRVLFYAGAASMRTL